MSSKKKNPNSPIAIFVQRARAALGLTQEQLGEIWDVTKGNVSHWENGAHNPDYSILVDLSNRSGVPMPLISMSNVEPSGFSANEVASKRDARVAELLKFVAAADDTGIEIIIDKARDVSRQYPIEVKKTA